MDTLELLKNIGARTNQDIYVGVVGPVRVGKSTFIQKFMELVVIENITDEAERRRAIDELPQAGQGKQIMTCEPKFVPNNAVKVKVDDELYVNIRLVDCVGYVFDEALGHKENDKTRMVKTPWFEDPIPFDEAAKLGTTKVIKEHSTIGIMITTDGSIVDLPRNAYVDVEEEVIMELKAINKPFIVIVNSKDPTSKQAQDVKEELEKKYDITAIAMSIADMTKEDATNILLQSLYEFPVSDVEVITPTWITILEDTHPVKMSFKDSINNALTECKKVKDAKKMAMKIEENENIKSAEISNINTATGLITINIIENDGLYEQVLNSILQKPINDKADLIKILQEYRSYSDNFSTYLPAINQARETGYGIAYPLPTDITINPPESIKQNNRYGIKIKASAPAIHMFKVDVEDTFEPILGSKQQADSMIEFLNESEENLKNLNVFGRSLNDMLKDGISAKLGSLSDTSKLKFEKALKIATSKQKSNIIILVF